jgi:hypothetical protein
MIWRKKWLGLAASWAEEVEEEVEEEAARGEAGVELMTCILDGPQSPESR